MPFMLLFLFFLGLLISLPILQVFWWLFFIRSKKKRYLFQEFQNENEKKEVINFSKVIWIVRLETERKEMIWIWRVLTYESNNNAIHRGANCSWTNTLKQTIKAMISIWLAKSEKKTQKMKTIHFLTLDDVFAILLLLSSFCYFFIFQTCYYLWFLFLLLLF